MCNMGTLGDKNKNQYVDQKKELSQLQLVNLRPRHEIEMRNGINYTSDVKTSKLLLQKTGNIQQHFDPFLK